MSGGGDKDNCHLPCSEGGTGFRDEPEKLFQPQGLQGVTAEKEAYPWERKRGSPLWGEVV